MRNQRLQFLKFSTYLAIGLLSLASCGLRKKEITRNLEVVQWKDSTGSAKFNSILIQEQFGDTLRGSFNVADSSGSDSVEFESQGIKLKLKVTGGKPGTKVNFNAQAKPTARSTLNQQAERKVNVSSGSKATLNESKKVEVKRLSGWVWFALILIVIGIIALVYQKVKRKLNPL